MSNKKPTPPPPGPGRPKGSRNKKTIANLERDVVEDLLTKVRDLAESYSERMLINLAEIALDAQAPAGVRVTASNAILDRSVGKPVQQQTVSVKGTFALTGILESIAAKGVNLNDVD